MLVHKYLNNLRNNLKNHRGIKLGLRNYNIITANSIYLTIFISLPWW
jgi:hypothetical protein